MVTWHTIVPSGLRIRGLSKVDIIRQAGVSCQFEGMCRSLNLYPIIPFYFWSDMSPNIPDFAAISINHGQASWLLDPFVSHHFLPISPLLCFLGDDVTIRKSEMRCTTGTYCKGGIRFSCPRGYYGSFNDSSSSLCSGTSVYTLLYYPVLWCTVLYSTILCCDVLYYTLLSCVVMYCIIVHYPVLRFDVHLYSSIFIYCVVPHSVLFYRFHWTKF